MKVRTRKALGRSSLADLQTLGDQIRQTALRTERDRQIARARVQQEQDESTLFRTAVGAVTLLPEPARAFHPPGGREPIALHSRRDEEAVLRASLDEPTDALDLLLAEESLSFQRPGIRQDALRKLRSGHWVVQGELDLHGLRREEARDMLAIFLHNALRRDIRCVRIIHGKGLGSPGKEPVLKGRVRHWLTQRQEVLAFVEASHRDGGSGAILVLLNPSRRPGQRFAKFE